MYSKSRCPASQLLETTVAGVADDCASVTRREHDADLDAAARRPADQSRASRDRVQVGILDEQLAAGGGEASLKQLDRRTPPYANWQAMWAGACRPAAAGESICPREHFGGLLHPVLGEQDWR